MPVSPPPTTTTRRPAALIALLGHRLRRRTSLLERHETVALVEVLHREVHAAQVAAGHLEVAVHARADREDHGVVALAQVVGRDVASHVDAVPELDPLLLEEVHAPVDDPLLELGVRHSEAQQPARALVALVDGHRVAVAVQLGGHGQPGRAGADHADGVPAALGRRARHDPALLEAARDDRQLDLLDRHGVVVDVEHAGRLAGRRADQPGELGEVVGGVQVRERLLPVAAVDEVVPVRDLVASGQPSWQNGMPQSMQRPPWSRSVCSAGSAKYCR